MEVVMTTFSHPTLALKMRDAARAIGCSTRTLHELVKRGEIRPRRLGTGPRAGLVFPLAELERWLREGAPQAGQGGARDDQ
jgi:predicted DNA-binding transcriptional regulator AlpA